MLILAYEKPWLQIFFSNQKKPEIQSVDREKIKFKSLDWS